MQAAKVRTLLFDACETVWKKWNGLSLLQPHEQLMAVTLRYGYHMTASMTALFQHCTCTEYCGMPVQQIPIH